MTRFNSFEKFTISSKPVIADYVHAGVFVPVFNTEDGSEQFTFSPLSNTATKLAYWDEEAWASELVVSSVTSAKKTNANDNHVKSATDRAAAAAENEGLLGSGKEAEIKAKKRKAEASAVAKQKKVSLFRSLRDLPFTVTDCTSPPAVLEQSPCRASRRQARPLRR